MCKCLVCGKPMRSGSSTHHIYWPRNDKWVLKLCRALRHQTVELHQGCHDDYHNYFMHSCQNVCHGVCPYWRICCYRK
jgi:hypothetical protein